MLRSNVIKASNLDTVCLCETFLKAEQTIDFPGYTWFGNTVSQYLNEHYGVLVG